MPRVRKAQFGEGTNGLRGPVVWQGMAYEPWAIQVKGFDKSGMGRLPRPTLTLANVAGTIGAMARDLNDLLGARVLRKRTFVRYLDAVNFPGGVNPTASPLDAFPDDEFVVDQKTVENKHVIEFSLAAKCDLDGVAIQNPDGTFNFTGVTLYDVKGTQPQEYIPGFPSGEAEHPVGVEVKRATPVVRTVTDPEVDAVRVTIQVPQLTYQDPTTGDLKPTRVLVSIAVQSNGGGYVVQSFQDAELFRGKCTSPYERTFRVELTGSPPWDIRVTRVSEDADSVTTQNKVIWKSYATLLDEKLSFPNTALCALQVSASQFSSIPTRSYRIRGLRVRVPNNYNPSARTYEGTWDGTWKVAWTDNPAWCFYDLLTTKRYGLGRYLNEAAVDKWGLYTVAMYCDELVPDGKGGMEPRFRCNLYLQTQENAYKVINNLASVFRGMTYWASGAVFVAQDAPRDAEYLFTPANVVDGLFTYASSSKRARHTVALVTWNNPDNHFKAAQEYVTDEEGLATYGYSPTEVVALGCTSRGQAQRVGRWLLLTERLGTETVTFRTGFEGAMRNPGAVVKLQDPYRAGRRWGGRVVAATASQVELDGDVTLEAGKMYAFSVVLPDGTVEERPLAALAPAPYRALTVATPFSAAPSPRPFGCWQRPT
ncbi:phage minor tail protein L [Corallococcus exiguus]|uniref:Phage minor tail protein L n=1 Tax=Corallococcus exiguus TaxID=83462 RepID=A0A7X5BSH0_9BACT|nr:phage minor tail protein L [Corallococcus exiguus]NBC41894.1 phage minor tail protein L [Corallococcus exiguus]TNV61597.1 phage minor tail protein L [Corallococcus exiguus]